jgi:hypothetical protein
MRTTDAVVPTGADREIGHASYTTTLTVDQSPEQAFDAINDVRGWWSEDIEGCTDKVDEEFTFRGKDIHYSRIRVTELIPGESVRWLVLDNYINFVDDQSEWKGTEIRFAISQKGDGAEIRFSHLGLVPAYECFDVCSNAWSFFIHDSLRSLIAAGEGQPMEKERGDGA